MGIEKHITDELDKWKSIETTPFFVFDGCPVKGEDKVSISVGHEAIAATDEAWARYAKGDAQAAVAAFGQSHSAYSRCRSHGAIADNNVLSRGIPSRVAPPTTPIDTEEARSAFPRPTIQGNCTGTHS